MSTSSFQTGLPSRLAHRSHTALTMAPVAMWMMPFSGPSHRSCGSWVRERKNVRMSEVTDSSVRPLTWWASARAAPTVSSLPRPFVNVSPWPSRRGSPVRSTT